MINENSALDRFVDQAGRLFSPPSVAVEILKLTSQPKVDLTALKQCLLRDPALVGKILRVVNSSLFGVSREVADLGQALALLGTKSVRLLVLGFSLPDELFVGLAGNILERYWHHTIVKATAAREISETLFRLPGEEPFIAGLLQDIGVLVLLQQLGQPYMRFLDRAFSKDVDVDTAESVALGFEHEQLSAKLLDRWGLPQTLVTAIGISRSAESIDQLPTRDRALPQILHLAHLVAGMLAGGRADALAQLQRVGRQYRQFAGADLSSLVAGLQIKVNQLAEVLSLQLPEGIDYQAIFSSAHRQLSIAAEDAAVAVARPESAVMEIRPTEMEDELLTASAELSEAAHRFLKEPAAKPISTLLIPAGTAAAEKSAGKKAAAMGAPTAPPKPQFSAGNSMSATLIESPPPDDGSKDTLTEKVQAAIAECRENRQPISLVVVALDRFAEIAKTVGTTESRRLVQLVSLLCGRVEHASTVQLKTDEYSFALVLTNCDRPAAGEIGHELLREVRRLCEKHADLASARLGVSVGVATAATPPKNFSASLLIQSARRCLDAAQLSGGNAMKTIDVL